MHELLLAIEKEKIINNWKLELILIDDGSRDGSFGQIQILSKQYTYIKGIKLARNFKKLLTGNLNSPVDSNPRFPGKERHLLRA